MPISDDDLRTRLRLGEDSRWEFKQFEFRGDRPMSPRREDLAEEVAAFANALGGTLLCGVADNGDIQSMSRPQLDQVELLVSEICRDSIEPPLIPDVQRRELDARALLGVAAIPSYLELIDDTKGQTVDFSMDDEQGLIVETVRRFVEAEIVPLEADLDPDAGELKPDDTARLTQMTREMGFYGLDIPAEYGGPGLDTTTRALMAIEMSKHRAGLYNPCYGVFGGAGLAQLYEATDEQKERWLHPTLRGEKLGCFALTEPSGGSDPGRAIHTRGFKDGDEWVLNGSKLFISGADKADYALLFARTSDDPGRNGVTAFIVDTDTPGFNVRRVVHTLRATRYATELEFVDMRVPESHVLGEVNGGFAIANDRLSRQRIPYAAGCLGPAIVAQEMAIEWAKSRETFGSLLAEKQAVQWMIVDNEIDIRHGRWCVLEAAQKADRGERFRTEAAMAKLVASEAAGRVVDRCIQIHGGMGVTKDLPLERWYRELRIRRIGEGPSEVQRLIMARDILGGSFK